MFPGESDGNVPDYSGIHELFPNMINLFQHMYAF